jgi:hypothetical protein
MLHGLAVCLLILFACTYLDSLRSGARRLRTFHADDREIERDIRRLDRQERMRSLYTAYQQPWPWWFLGSCLAFSGLCLGAGLWQWRTPDAPVLIIGGLVFGLASAFKAWAQALAPQERLLEPPVPQ